MANNIPYATSEIRRAVETILSQEAAVVAEGPYGDGFNGSFVVRFQDGTNVLVTISDAPDPSSVSG